MNERAMSAAEAAEADEQAGWSQQAATEYAQWCAEQDDEDEINALLRGASDEG